MSCLHPAVRVVILLWQVDLLLCSPICCSVQEAIEELSVVLKGPAVAGKPVFSISGVIQGLEDKH